MPTSLHTSTGIAQRNSVLLVEEYGALAAAIGSALRKFAPDHVVQIARTFAKGDDLAAELPLSLVVVDVDPPQAGAIAFFSKMKESYPDARALVITPIDMGDIAAEVGSILNFIEKPFELAEFGATVQALLNPSVAAGSNKLRGMLRDLRLIDVLFLKHSAGATETVIVEAPGGRTGAIHFRNGQMYHAVAMRSSGPEALAAMLRWQKARFGEIEAATDSPTTISGPWKSVLLDAIPEVKEAGDLTSLAQLQRSKPVEKKAKSGKKIVVIDDTEMLLIFVAEVLSWNNDDWEVITASTGIDGQQQVEQNLPDMVLLDYCLPDIKGDEVCRRLLSKKQTSRIPIIMMSGHVAEMDAAQARYENVVATIAKPFLSRDLIELVRKTRVGGKVRKRSGPSPPPKPEIIVSASPAVPIADHDPSGNGTNPATEVPFGAVASPVPKIILPSATVATSSPPVSDVKLPSAIENEVVLGLPLEVTSMQLTPLLKIGSLRARPSALAISLRIRSSLLRGPLPLEAGFELGPVQLDAHGRIDMMRLIPTPRPANSTPPAMSSFAVETVDIPASARHRVQITPSVKAPMTMQLLAHFRLLAVELATNLEIGALFVKAHEGSVRATLDSHASADEESAATFEYVSVRLDDSARIAELTLSPLD